MLRSIRTRFSHLQLPAAARAEHRNDALGLPEQDPGVDLAIEEGIAWLCHAQDYSVSADGGVAEVFSIGV
jgi:hypothetical protein